MNHPETVPQQPSELRSDRQYSLRSLLVTTVTIAMVLAYIKLFGPSGLQLAILAAVGSLVWGGLLGWFGGRLVETLSWSQLISVLALCCVLSTDRITPFQQLYWLHVGVVSGAFAGFVTPGRWVQRVAWTLAIWVPFAVISLVCSDGLNGMLDMLMTLPVVAAVAFLAELVDRLQRRFHTAFDVWALGLVFAVIAGNFGAIAVWDWWYA